MPDLPPPSSPLPPEVPLPSAMSMPPAVPELPKIPEVPPAASPAAGIAAEMSAELSKRNKSALRKHEMLFHKMKLLKALGVKIELIEGHNPYI